MNIHLLLFSVFALVLFSLFIIGIVCPQRMHRHFNRQHHKRRQPYLFTILFFLALLPFVGCAHFSSHQLRTDADGSQVESRQSVTTFFDAKTDIAKLRASTTDKTQGLTVGSIGEETNGSNAVAIVNTAVSAAVSAAVKSAKP